MKLKYYLIAGEQNDYQPWIMSSKAIALFTFVIWGLKILIPASLTIAATYIDPSDIMVRINAERSQRFIQTLITNDKLSSAAQAKSDDMLTRSYFAHIDPDGNYVWPKIVSAGYTPYITLGENLAMDFTSAPELVSAWMNSPTHRGNILNTKFEDQGIALATGLYEPNHTTTLVTSLFGTLSKSATKNPPTKTEVSSSASTTPTDVTPPDRPATELKINSNADINITQVSGQVQIEIDVQILGDVKLATARLKTQSITLLAKETERFAGKFTFDSSENLNGEKVTIEARDAAGNKTTSQIALSGIETGGSGPAPTLNAQTNQIAVSAEAQLIKILRIIFGALSVIYLLFLIIDAIIIHRAKIERPGIHSTPQIVVFLLVATINLFAGKF